MNLILFDSAEDRAHLEASDPRLDHVRGVLRLGVGDSFDVGAVNGPRGKATIQAIDNGRVALSFQWLERPALPPALHLLIGLSRPQTCRRILQEAATLGVRSLHFAPTGKSDPAFVSSRLWRNGDADAYLRAGAEQAFDTYVPSLTLSENLPTALASLREQVRDEEPLRLALDPYESSGHFSEVIHNRSPLCLAIGPERGWNGRDRDLLRSDGFVLADLGPRILRVETAVVAVLSLAHAALRTAH